MTATAKQFLAALASQVGYREGRDPDGNWNNDNKFGVWYGMNRQPWCAMFQSWGADQVGALGTLVPKYAACTTALKWFRDRGQTGVWPPKPGDIFILREYAPARWNADPDGWAPIHTGAVESWVPIDANSGYNVTLEGNTNDGGSAQGNGVYRLRRYDSADGKYLIYCRPKWAPEPPPPPPAPAPTTSRDKPRTPVPPVIPGSVYTGSTAIATKLVRPNARNEATRRFNATLWAWLCKNSPAYARANVKAWWAEPGNLYGKQSQLATQEAYRVLAARKPAVFARVTLPTWPGALLVKAIGGTPVIS